MTAAVNSAITYDQPTLQSHYTHTAGCAAVILVTL